MALSRASRPKLRRKNSCPKLTLEALESRCLLTADVIISEFMAVNESARADGDGDFSDWLELKNASSQVIDLEGWYLTDDADAVTKWRLPSVELFAGETLLVYASGKDRNTNPQRLHTNFQLSGDGEDLLLVRPDGTVAHGYEDFPPQISNVSYGLPNTESVFQKVLSEGNSVSYVIPTADVGDWTSREFDDSQWTDSIPLTVSPVVISEVGTDGSQSFVELQSIVSTTTDTNGWQVIINDPSSGVNGLNSTAWSLQNSFNAFSTTYRSSEVGDNYWGAPFNWSLDDDGWVMLLDEGGDVVDFVAWGYSAEDIANINLTVGPHSDIRVGDHWKGEGAERGSLQLGDGFLAFNDHIEGSRTGSNVTTYAANGVASGALKDARTGATTSATISTSQSGVAFQTNGANPSTGTDAFELFDGFVDFSSASGSSLEISGADHYTYSFGDLDRGSVVTYDFAGTAIRGNSNYTNRWTLVTLAGASSATPAHSEGDGVVVVSPTEVAIWVGHNSAPGQGYVAAWDDIDPGVDGRFTVISRQYTGPTPGVGTGTANGSKGYGLAGVRLQENVPNRPLSVLQRIGAADRGVAGDFARVEIGTKGIANPSLQIPLDDSVVATTGIGFSDRIEIESLIATDVGESMLGTNSSIWMRTEFEIEDLSQLEFVTLSMQYEDGYIAYLNGTAVARDNAPEVVAFDSAATVNRLDGLTSQYVDIDISDYRDQLVTGTNVLAIHGLNDASGDGEFFLQPEISIGTSLPEPQYMTTPTPDADNVEGLLGRVDDTKFNVDRGFYSSPFSLSITTDTPDATIRYTVDGTEPTANNGLIYSQPITIDETTTLRAAAFKPGFLPTNIDTQTYIFVADVPNQTSQETLNAGFPASWNGTSPDYGMDFDVVGPNDRFGGKYVDRIEESLLAIPSLSLVLDIDDMFGSSGIYSNPTNHNVEVATSAELINPDGSNGFQIDAGLKIQGGAFRNFGLTKKNSFRLKFKSEYGSSKLNYPFFGEDATNQFDTITFRMESNDGWQWTSDTNRLYARDQFGRETQLAMGQPGSHGTHVHIYINGFYWGLFNAVERPDEAFTSTYIGGEKDEWDVQNSGNAVNGDFTSWNQLRSLAAAVDSATTETARTAAFMRVLGRNPDGSDNPAWENYLDVDNYADYLINNWYGGNEDWPQKNYYAGRQRGPDSEGFQFFVWDYEWTLNLRSTVNTNKINDGRGIAEPFQDLRDSSEFRLQFADRVHKHLFNGGALYVNPSSPSWNPDQPENNIPAARFAAILDRVRVPLVAESARWGDQHRSTPQTVDESWESVGQSLLEDYFPFRTRNLLTHLRSAGLYPSTTAPSFSQHGGSVDDGFELSITAPTGEIYFTTDGSDPRVLGGGVSDSASAYQGAIPIVEAGTIKARVLRNGAWSALNEAFFVVDRPADATNLRVTEINYHPHAALAQFGEVETGDEDDREFIELQNISTESIELQGVRFTRGIDFEFGQQTLAPGERVVVPKDISAFVDRYGDSVRLAEGFDGLAGEDGVFSGSLSNGGETLKLVDADGRTIQEFEYDDSNSWPGRADGNGSSLIVEDVNGDYEDSDNWQPSNQVGGSPGTGETSAPALLVNEVLAHTDLPFVDSIELYNASDETIDASGWLVSDSNDDYFKYQLPIGTEIAPGGYLVIDENDFNSGNAKPFALSSNGDDVWLIAADRITGKPTHFVDRVEFGATPTDVSIGRLPSGDPNAELVPLERISLGSTNLGHRVGDVVITEVQYNPPGDDSVLEFFELYNRTDVVIDLSDWRIADAVDIDFESLVLGPKQTAVVVGFDPSDPVARTQFLATYQVDLAAINLVGPWDDGDSLDNGGETITLESPNGLGSYLFVDQVNYDDDAPWAVEADGSGVSLQRLSSVEFGSNPISFVANSPTPGDVDFRETRVVGRYLYYNESTFGNVDGSQIEALSQSIAPDKEAYVRGSGQASFSHYSSYYHGVNGVMIDVVGLKSPSEVSAADFNFRVGNSSDPGDWTAATLPAVNVYAGSGVGGSDRITLQWQNGSIVNQWLEVQVLANARTDLGSADVFYFGSAVGDTGNSPQNSVVDASDFAAVLANPRGFLNRAEIDSAFDFNRDTFVDATDIAVVRDFETGAGDSLLLLDLQQAVAKQAIEAAPLMFSSSLRTSGLGEPNLLRSSDQSDASDDKKIASTPSVLPSQPPSTNDSYLDAVDDVFGSDTSSLEATEGDDETEEDSAKSNSLWSSPFGGFYLA